MAEDIRNYLDAHRCCYKTLNIAAKYLRTKHISVWPNKFLTLAAIIATILIGPQAAQALDVITLDANTWNSKGFDLNNSGNYREALLYFDKALEIDPGLAHAWNNKGFALNNLGRYREAVESLDKALEIDP
ncbi:MAG: tetratricopeptide repeat protein, partial [Candidatus Brocadiales bacterium]